METILTQKNRLVTDKTQFEIIQQLSFYSARLYNEGLYNVRQYFFNNNNYLNYGKNYHVCKTSINYKMLLTDIAQQTLRLVERNFKSFFALLKMKNAGKYSDRVSPPKYKREKYGIIAVCGRSARIKNGYVLVGLTTEFKNTFKPNETALQFKLPKNIQATKLQEIRIIPKFDGKEFEIEFVYKKEVQPPAILDTTKYLSIDCGVNNFATCFDSTNGASFILNGKRLKSINHWYNQEKARLQGIYEHQKRDINTKRFIKLSKQRTDVINDFMNRSVKAITNYCVKNGIGNIVMGDFQDIKQGINNGKRNNQNFVCIPFGVFKRKLKSKCEQVGVTYAGHEESYTSKCSFLDNETIGHHDSYLGSRVKRGLFKTQTGVLVNADVNGSANILRKYLTSNNRLGVLDSKRVSKGFVNNPSKVKSLTVIPF
jgi:putative transposase